MVADMRYRRQIERLHRLGPRILAELLAELASERNIRTTIEQKIETYADLGPEALRAIDGDTFWPAPLHEVRDG